MTGIDSFNLIWSFLYSSQGGLNKEEAHTIFLRASLGAPSQANLESCHLLINFCFA